MGATDAGAPVPPVAAQDLAHAAVLVPGLAPVDLRAVAQSLVAARNPRMDRNRRKNLVLVHVQINLVTTASRNHALGHRNGIGMNPDRARDRVRSHTLAHVPSPRTTNPARDHARGLALRVPILDPVTVRNPQTSPMTSRVRHHPKITITLRSVMKAWKTKHIWLCLRMKEVDRADEDDVLQYLHLYFIDFFKLTSPFTHLL